MSTFIEKTALLLATIGILQTTACSLADRRADAQGVLALTHASVVDVASGQVQPDRTIVIRGGRIADVVNGSRFTPPPGARLVDARERYAVPGLWDMHIHLSYATASALPVLIATGVTSVRDMGSRLSEVDRWRDEIRVGVRVGPRIVRPGPMLNGVSFNAYQVAVRTPEEASTAVRTLVADGVDFIKIHRRVPREAYYALMAEARRLGVGVAGHVPLGVSVLEASDAGQVSIEHTETLFEDAVADGELLDLTAKSILPHLAAKGPAMFAKFVANGTVVTPTLAAWKVELAARKGGVPDPNLRYVAASVRTAPKLPASFPIAEVFEGLCDTVREMNRAGVTLMAGTDTSVGRRIPGFLLHDELAALVECGLTPAAALRSATLVPAQFLKEEANLGAIAAGKLADIVLLDANPLDDIRNTRRIWAVIAGGRLHDRGDLDRLLRDAEQSAARH